MHPTITAYSDSSARPTPFVRLSPNPLLDGVTGFLAYPFTTPLRAAVTLPCLLAVPILAEHLPALVHKIWG